MKRKTPNKAHVKNTRFPGRPHYTGPTSGMFGFVHHAVLYECSYGIRQRVRIIRNIKPADERAIRLWHLVYLGRCGSRWDTKTQGDVLKMIKRYIPKPRWNGHSLLKADGTAMTGR